MAVVTTLRPGENFMAVEEVVVKPRTKKAFPLFLIISLKMFTTLGFQREVEILFTHR